MSPLFEQKSSLEEIRKRFDNDVVRFSNLETGQSATIDAPLVMELIAQAAFKSTKNIRRVLDIGCGAGNSTLKLMQYVSSFDSYLIDLSLPMLQKAHERISSINLGKTKTIQGDFRTIEFPDHSYDVILATAVLHHLRDDQDWEKAFNKLYKLIVPGGSIWISDLVSHESKGVQSLMWENMENTFFPWAVPITEQKYLNASTKKIHRDPSPINWICFAKQDLGILTSCTKILVLPLLVP